MKLLGHYYDMMGEVNEAINLDEWIRSIDQLICNAEMLGFGDPREEEKEGQWPSTSNRDSHTRNSGNA